MQGVLLPESFTRLLTRLAKNQRETAFSDTFVGSFITASIVWLSAWV